MNAKVAVVILNWKGKDDTLTCVRSVLEATYAPLEVVVVDNASGGDDVASFRAAFGDSITLIENAENLGYAGGNNVGLSHAFARGAAFAVVLNNDTEVRPNFIEPLVAAAERDPQVGIAGPKTYFRGRGTELYFAGGYVNWWSGTYGHVGLGEQDGPAFSREGDTEYVAGSCMLLTLRLFQTIGGIPEQYFLLFEDIEYNLAAQRAGFRTVYVPDSVILHEYSGTINQGLQKISYTRIYYSNRNRILFFRRNASRQYWPTEALFFTFFEGPKRLAYWMYCNRNWTTVRVFFRGLKDGLRGRTGRVSLP